MESEHIKNLKNKKIQIEQELALEEQKRKELVTSDIGGLFFYEFNQNNSGGSFDVDDKVCHKLIIQAPNHNTARNKAMELGVYFNGCDNGLDCSCCGDRWNDYNEDHIDLTKENYNTHSVLIYYHSDENTEKQWEEKYRQYEVIEEPKLIDENTSFKKYFGKVKTDTIEKYAQFMANEHGWTKPDIRIYYWDGSMKEFFKK